MWPSSLFTKEIVDNKCVKVIASQARGMTSTGKAEGGWDFTPKFFRSTTRFKKKSFPLHFDLENKKKKKTKYQNQNLLCQIFDIKMCCFIKQKNLCFWHKKIVNNKCVDVIASQARGVTSNKKAEERLGFEAEFFCPNTR